MFIHAHLSHSICTVIFIVFFWWQICEFWSCREDLFLVRVLTLRPGAKKKRSYISAIQTVEEDPLMLLLGACTTPPEATSWLETFARLAFLSQKEVTFKSTFKCVNIRHSLVLEIYFEQSYWCMLGSSQIRNCGSLNLCKSVCMFWYLPNIYMWQNLRRSSSISGMASLLEPPII